MKRKFLVLLYGVVNHVAFVCGVTIMFVSLYTGKGLLGYKVETVRDGLLDFVFLLQFPILHSFLLSPQGAKWLDILFPVNVAKQLRTTTFSFFASLQLLVTFLFWRDTGIVLAVPQNIVHELFTCAYICSWLLLAKSIFEAGAGLQTGFIGWSAVFLGKNPVYPRFPQCGLHAKCRHPIYLSFALILLTSPAFTLDRLLVASVWVPYCFVGPLFKEWRFLRIYKDDYEIYRSRTSYIFPMKQRLAAPTQAGE